MAQYLNWGKGRADVIVKLRGHFVTHIEVGMHLLTCNPGDTESLMFTLLCLRLKIVLFITSFSSTVDKREIAVQTTFEEMLNEHSDKLNDIELCSEMNEDDGLISTDSNAENDIVSSDSVKQSLCGVQQAMNNYTAFRLANPFMRSPMSERRTVP